MTYAQISPQAKTSVPEMEKKGWMIPCWKQNIRRLYIECTDHWSGKDSGNSSIDSETKKDHINKLPKKIIDFYRF